MDFKEIANNDGFIENKYAAKDQSGKWLTGLIDFEFLNTHFGVYTTATEMKANTSSEGLKLFFDDLVSQGKLQP